MKRKPVGRKKLKGVLGFYFDEPATEGGDWAFQDSRFIRKCERVSHSYCQRCGRWLDQDGLPIPGPGRVYPGGRVTRLPDCPRGSCERVNVEVWDYRGSHILKDGDHLTIYSKGRPRRIVWSGIVKLSQSPSFKEQVFGRWIHADQVGVKRETWARWFFEGYPATLMPAPKKGS